MNDKNQRIEEFLAFFRDIAKENPDYVLTDKAVYDKLTGFGVLEGRKRINENFEKWIEHFKRDYRCEVFVSPAWQYFCQFISTDRTAQYAGEHLKVYVPLDSAHIERGANEIFEFLSREGITHLSKIGSHVRMDDIVVRLVNPGDLEKLTNFVKNNQYIQEGLIKPNPFCFNNNGLAMAVDGNISFNSTVASLIALYINNHAKNNNLDNVNFNDFRNFVYQYYEKAFSSKKGLDMLSNDFEKSEGRSFDSSLFQNYKNVIELIMKSMSKDFTYSDYIEHYRKCSNKQLQRSLNTDMAKLMAGRDEKEEKNGYSIDEKKVILSIRDIISVMSEKYGKTAAIEGLTGYIVTGDSTYLTRTDGLRSRIASSSFREDLLKILDRHNVNVSTYLNIVSDVTVGTDEIYLEQAIMETYRKYEGKYQEGTSNVSGKDFAMGATKMLIRDGVYRGFTRDNGARNNLMENVPSYSVKRIIMRELGIESDVRIAPGSLDAFIEQYVENVIKNNKRKQM